MNKKIILISVIGFIILLGILFLMNRTKKMSSNPEQTSLEGITHFPTNNYNSVNVSKSQETGTGNSRPIKLVEDEQMFERQNNPDLFLSNSVPYENQYFQIRSEFTKDPSGHFYFLVYVKGTDKNNQNKNL